MPGLRTHWHPVGTVDRIGTRPVGFRLLDTDVVVWRADATLCAAVDRCPHRMARLSNGTVTNGCLECPYHAWTFGRDGAAVTIPQLDAGTAIPPAARLRMVHVAERYGLVWVALDDPTKPVPHLAEAEHPGYRLIPSFDESWHAPAPWIADNAIDIAHVNVVHATTIGNAAERRLAPYEIEPTAHGFVARMRLSVAGASVQSGSNAPTVERSMEVEVLGPFTTRVAITYPNGTEHVLFIMACPIDDTSSRYLQLLARNDREEDVAAADLLALDREVVREDRLLCEAMPVDFAIDPRQIVSVRADRITIEYRRYLAAAALGE